MPHGTRIAIGNRPTQIERNESVPSEATVQNPVVELSGELIVVYGDKIHVWHDSIHYVEVGKADEINPGDVFFESQEVGYRLVQVTDVNSACSDEIIGGVTVDLLYDEPSLDSDTDGKITSVEWSKQMLTGIPLEDAPMGYTGPPIRLEETDS